MISNLSPKWGRGGHSSCPEYVNEHATRHLRWSPQHGRHNEGCTPAGYPKRKTTTRVISPASQHRRRCDHPDRPQRDSRREPHSVLTCDDLASVPLVTAALTGAGGVTPPPRAAVNPLNFDISLLLLSAAGGRRCSSRGGGPPSASKADLACLSIQVLRAPATSRPGTTALLRSPSPAGPEPSRLTPSRAAVSSLRRSTVSGLRSSCNSRRYGNGRFTGIDDSVMLDRLAAVAQPLGAGRTFSGSSARREFTREQLREAMVGIEFLDSDAFIVAIPLALKADRPGDRRRVVALDDSAHAAPDSERGSV